MSVKTKGFEKVTNLLSKKQEQIQRGRGKKVTVVIGYSAPYAVFVHENLQSKHLIGMAKWLDYTMKTFRGELVSKSVRELNRKQGMERAMTEAGKLLLELAKPFVPVDTGFLRSSGYVRVE